MTAAVGHPAAPYAWRATSLVRVLHRWNARLLGVFLVAHLANHVQFLSSAEGHLQTMDTLRVVYRLPPLEIALYGLFFAQVGLGLMLAAKHWRPSKGWSWAQVISGLLLGIFILQHLLASLGVRFFEADMETNAWWALSVAQHWPLKVYFVPYYFIGVLALFVHVAAAVRFARYPAGHKTGLVIAGVGFVVASLIVGAMAINYDYDSLPAAYQAYVEGLMP